MYALRAYVSKTQPNQAIKINSHKPPLNQEKF